LCLSDAAFAAAAARNQSQMLENIQRRPSSDIRLHSHYAHHYEVRTIVQKFDIPIVDSIGQKNRPIQWRCDNFYSVLFKQQFSIKNSILITCFSQNLTAPILQQKIFLKYLLSFVRVLCKTDY